MYLINLTVVGKDYVAVASSYTQTFQAGGMSLVRANASGVAPTSINSDSGSYFHYVDPVTGNDATYFVSQSQAQIAALTANTMAGDVQGTTYESWAIDSDSATSIIIKNNAAACEIYEEDGTTPAATVIGALTCTTIGASGSITLGAGADLIGSATSDITINTDKFTVAGATGNTVIAGTLGVTGAATFNA